jgi:hypothetical protein
MNRRGANAPLKHPVRLKYLSPSLTREGGQVENDCAVERSCGFGEGSDVKK